jgi:hypothetical protein
MQQNITASPENAARSKVRLQTDFPTCFGLSGGVRAEVRVKIPTRVPAVIHRSKLPFPSRLWRSFLKCQNPNDPLQSRLLSQDRCTSNQKKFYRCMNAARKHFNGISAAKRRSQSFAIIRTLFTIIRNSSRTFAIIHAISLSPGICSPRRNCPRSSLLTCPYPGGATVLRSWFLRSLSCLLFKPLSSPCGSMLHQTRMIRACSSFVRVFVVAASSRVSAPFCRLRFPCIQAHEYGCSCSEAIYGSLETKFSATKYAIEALKREGR